MNIVADHKIPFLAEAVAGLGELRMMAPGSITSEVLRDAQVLLVRSVTTVDAELLAGSSVELVGSATSGTDHVDHDALVRLGVQFAAAPGCNAHGVAEYVIAALHRFAAARGCSAVPQPIGIVGFGHVGRSLARMCHALGWEFLVCDPPLAKNAVADGVVGGSEAALMRGLSYQPLSAVLSRCPVVSLHVPLTRQGADPTLHMIAVAELRAMAPGSVLVNTSRGAVIDSWALQRAGGHLAWIMDVWEGEPELDWEMLDHTSSIVATPHVAGYTLEGKVAATRAMHAALARFVGRRPYWTGADVLSEPRRWTLTTRDDELQTVASALDRACGLSKHDRALRNLRMLPRAQRAAAFEQLRRSSPERRAFTGQVPHLEGPAGIESTLRRLGFATAAARQPEDA